MEVASDISRSVEVIRQTVAPACDLTQELVSEMIAVVGQDIVAVGKESLAEARDQNMINLELSHCQHSIFRVLRVKNRNGVLKDE